MNNIDKARTWIRYKEEDVMHTITLMIAKEIVDNELVLDTISVVETAAKIVIFSKTTPIKWYTYWSKTVIGYYRNGMFYINRRNNLSVSKTVEFLCHEACHRAGLKHDAIKWYKRNRAEVMQSLVYRIGREIGGMYE